MAWGLFRRRRARNKDARQAIAPRQIFPASNQRPSRWTRKAKLIMAANLGAAGILAGMLWPKSAEAPATRTVERAPVMQRIESEPRARAPERIVEPRINWNVRTPTIDESRALRTISEITQFARQKYSSQGKKIKPLPKNVVDNICSRVQNETGIEKELLKAFLYKETSGDPTRVGSALELGWFQLKPEKIIEIQQKFGYAMSNPQDPYENAIAFAYAMRGYVDNARNMKVAIGEGKQKQFYAAQRQYKVGNQYVTFDQLPLLTQIQLIAAIHNKGADGAFSEGIIERGIYDPQKIISNSRYAQQLGTAYKKKDYSYAE